MQRIEHSYINGEFVVPHGEEWFDLVDPSSGQVNGQLRLGDEEDARRAIAAAAAAFPAWSRTTRQERLAALRRIHTQLVAREDELLEAVVGEYGAPSSRARWMAQYPAQTVQQAIETLEAYPFEEQAGAARVVMTPVGVAALITPWNSNAGFICNKLATALAAGCTAVIKPSEMSGWQTRVVIEALHAAELPAGRVQHRQRSRRGGRRDLRARSARRQDLLHGFVGGRPAPGGGRRGRHEARHAGAGRQVAHHRA